MDRLIFRHRDTSMYVVYKNSMIGNGETHLFLSPPTDNPDIVPLSVNLMSDAYRLLKDHGRDPRGYVIERHSNWRVNA